MSIQAKTAVNQPVLHQKAESLNRAFNEKEPISLADLQKKLLSIKVRETAERVFGIISGGIALSFNPTATIMGGLFGACVLCCIDVHHDLSSSPKFEVKNNRIVQTNYEYTKKLDHWKGQRLGFLFIDTLSAGSLTANHQYPFPGGEYLSTGFSFYSGFRGVAQAYHLVSKFI